MKRMTEQEYRAEVRRINRDSRVWAALLDSVQMVDRAEASARHAEATGAHQDARKWRKEARILQVLREAALDNVRAR